MLRHLKSLPVQLIGCIVVAVLIGDVLPEPAIRLFFALSCTVKEALMFVLPFVIFSYLTSAILSLDNKAPVLIFLVIGLATASNALVGLFSYGIGVLTIPLLNFGSGALISNGMESITPLYCFSIPDFVTPDQALLAGLAVGVIFSFIHVPRVNQWTETFRRGVTGFLQRIFIPVLPVYVFGFVLKIQREGALELLLGNYAQVFGLSCFILLLFLLFLYWVGAGFNRKKTFQALQNMFPAGITAFSTMSSAATMPVTLEASEKNLENPKFADLVIPTTVNIHWVGDGIMTPLMLLTVMTLSGLAMPDFSQYLTFLMYFCVTRFSTAAIPGGGIIILIPVFQSVLGLSPELTSLMTTLYILQDSVITTSNVMGNGAFAMISERLMGSLGRGSLKAVSKNKETSV